MEEREEPALDLVMIDRVINFLEFCDKNLSDYEYCMQHFPPQQEIDDWFKPGRKYNHVHTKYQVYGNSPITFFRAGQAVVERHQMAAYKSFHKVPDTFAAEIFIIAHLDSNVILNIKEMKMLLQKASDKEKIELLRQALVASLLEVEEFSNQNFLVLEGLEKFKVLIK